MTIVVKLVRIITTNVCICVVHGFFDGPQNTESLFDVAFGIVAVIVLLNVVVAIVR